VKLLKLLLTSLFFICGVRRWGLLFLFVFCLYDKQSDKTECFDYIEGKRGMLLEGSSRKMLLCDGLRVLRDVPESKMEGMRLG